MERMTVYPKNEKQKSLVISLLKEINVRFVIECSIYNTLLNEEDFFAKIDKSIDQAEKGNTKTLTIAKQKEFLGLWVIQMNKPVIYEKEID